MNPSERRIHFRPGLSTIYQPYYDKLCDCLSRNWAPYAGYRTFPAQDLLWAQGRSSPGGIVTHAKGGESPHCYGCASDWTRFDDSGHLLWLKKEDPLWQEYIDAVVAVGLRPGSEFGDVDHNEVRISCDWPHILVEFNQNGMRAAMEKIGASLA